MLDDARLDAARREQPQHQVVEIVRLEGRIADDALVGGVRKVHHRVLRERMTVGQRERHRLPQHKARAETVAADRRAHQRDVEAAGRQRLELRGRHSLAQRDVDAGQLALERAHDARQEVVARSRREADRHRASLALGDPADRLRRALRDLEQAARLRQQRAARGGERNPPVGAIEQVLRRPDVRAVGSAG